MSPMKRMFLLQLFLMVSVSARTSLLDTNLKKSTEESKHTDILITAGQKRYVVTQVCNESLEAYLNFSEIAIGKCKDKFRWNTDENAAGYRMQCRSATNSGGGVTLAVPPSNMSLLLLVPNPNNDDPDSIIYNIVDPNSRYTDGLVVDPGTNYSMYSAELDRDGTPVLWHREADIPEWKVPDLRNYHVQVKFDVTNDSINGLFYWNRTGEFDACFRLEINCYTLKYSTVKIWPGSPTSKLYENLPPNDSCQFSVYGSYGPSHFDFRTPASNVSNKVIKVQPKLTWVETIYVLAEDEDGEKWTIHVSWPKPPVTPEVYKVTVTAGNIVSVIVPGNGTTARLKGVATTENGVYNVSVDAMLGDKRAHNSVRAPFPYRVASGANMRVVLWAVAAGVAWAATALAVAVYSLRTCRLTIAPPLKPKPIPLQKADPPVVVEPCVEPPVLEDAWEITPERLTMFEIIGEGAFGVVRRGTLAPLGNLVAVKMLKDLPTTEEMRAFHLEMELMKSVGAHPHVVSLIGCCSTRRPAIVAEYCSRGDLLNFLRCSWDVMMSKRNSNYYNNNISINNSEYRNDLFKVPQEYSRLVVNRLYDLQQTGETNLTPMDLLSFCRQIAMGMEFLALNKLVHRDLAARNILVTSEKTLKIADFGLSRDVYEGNEYKQKGNGKVPVKWMALESLTRRIYTTQSDVWSFGVVIWEVVTVGGAPYAGVSAARLPRLLHTGYRMPRPPNCSRQLYELMRQCWAACPRDRPTFPELHARLDELLNSASAADYLILELDYEPPPAPRPHRYLRMILRAKRNWARAESYERPLKALHNDYSSPPVSHKSHIRQTYPNDPAV